MRINPGADSDPKILERTVGMEAAERTSDVESNKRANGGSRSIHTFLSITGRPLKLLNNRDWGGDGGLYGSAEGSAPRGRWRVQLPRHSSTSSRLGRQRRLPSHSPITGRLRRSVSSGL